MVSDPAFHAAIKKLCSRAPSDIAASISWVRPRKGVWIAACPLDHRRKILGNALIQCGPDEIGLGRKSPVERSFTHTRPASDGPRLRIGPNLGVDLPRGAQYAFDVARRVRA